MPSPYTPKTSSRGCTRGHLAKGCLTIILVITGVYLFNIIVAFINFETNYNKWKSAGITSYSVTIKDGIWGGRYLSEIRETVENNQLVAGESSVPTIDRMFGEARGCIWVFPLCSVEYDAVYGYPAMISTNDFDLGRVTALTDFVPVE